MTRTFFASVARSMVCAALAAYLGCPGRASQNALPLIESKKGLQVQMVDDALALGVHHAAINVNFAQLPAASSSAQNYFSNFDGKRYEFSRRYIDSLDSKIRPLSKHGVTVYLILLAYYNKSEPELSRPFIHPRFEIASKAPISAFNTREPVAVARFQACVDFLVRRYALEGTPPVHFIVGNEVNSHWFWYNMGAATMETVTVDYEHTVRICHEVVHAASPSSRVFLSLDHNWNSGVSTDPLKSFGARAFLQAFAKLARQNGDFDWHLAFHPYPENLFEARTWNDHNATMNLDTPKITFKNIALLNDFMKRPELLHDGKSRRIILSEQGFHSKSTPDGELVQAAAYAYSYRKVEQLDGIDAFILHRHVDHLHEGGLNLGLWTCDSTSKPLKKKLIYNVFLLADTDEWEKAFKFALPVIGVHEWSEIR